MKIYYCNIDDFRDLAGAELLSPARWVRMQRYLKPEDQIRCLTAGLLLRMAFGERIPEMRENTQGKPYLPLGPFFNLSHSGTYVVLGVSEHEIGVDIEQIAPFDDRVARRCYTEKELAWLYAQNNTEAFYRLWTAKESIMKATGLGFTLPPESFSVLPMEDGWHTIRGQRWFLQWNMLPGHAICSACASAETVQLIHTDRSTIIL